MSEGMIEKHQEGVLEGKSIRVSIKFLRDYQTKTFERDLNKFLSVQLSKIYSGRYNEFKKELNGFISFRPEFLFLTFLIIEKTNNKN